ncbi:MAG TPA: hypothetical protein PK208_07190 [Fibrobacteria bacterium]|nr:hypothetical protein [Fibrobacteria bacterium]
MPEFKGQLGSKLDVSLNSVLVSCRWSIPAAAVGGEVAMVANTAYVGDGTAFDFTVLDETGSKLATAKGTSVSNSCSAKWTVSDKAKGRLLFLAESSSLGLSGRSDALRVMERVKIGPVEALDDKGGALAKATIGQKMRWKAAMPGVPNGTQAKWEVLCRQDKAHAHAVSIGMVEVQNSEAVVDWETRYPMDQGCKDHQADLDKTSEKYEDATFEASFSCLGSTAKSKPVPVKTEVGVRFIGADSKKKVKQPDGSEQSKEIKHGDELILDDIGVGSTQFAKDGK